MQLFKEEEKEEGERNHLISQICRKLHKGNNTVEIGEDLEEDEACEHVI